MKQIWSMHPYDNTYESLLRRMNHEINGQQKYVKKYKVHIIPHKMKLHQ